MNIRCNLFGHKMRTVTDNIAGPHQCIRKNCDHTEPAVESPTRDFPEDSEQENGNYSNICCDCKTPFIGSKHRRRCKVCHDSIGLTGHTPKLTDDDVEEYWTRHHRQQSDEITEWYNDSKSIVHYTVLRSAHSEENRYAIYNGNTFVGVLVIQPDPQPQWKPVDQHDTIGWCWIKYKNRVRHAWYKGESWFMFSEHGMTGCYMTECISGVIAIEVPTL